MKELSYHCAIRYWLEMVLPPSCFVFDPANGEKRDPGTAAKLRRMGVKPGVPDLAIISSGGRIAFVEVKTPKGRSSPEQRAFQLWCIERCVPYAVCTTIDDVRAFLASLRIETREVA